MPENDLFSINIGVDEFRETMVRAREQNMRDATHSLLSFPTPDVFETFGVPGPYHNPGGVSMRRRSEMEQVRAEGDIDTGVGATGDTGVAGATGVTGDTGVVNYDFPRQTEASICADDKLLPRCPHCEKDAGACRGSMAGEPTRAGGENAVWL